VFCVVFTQIEKVIDLLYDTAGYILLSIFRQSSIPSNSKAPPTTPSLVGIASPLAFLYGASYPSSATSAT